MNIDYILNNLYILGKRAINETRLVEANLSREEELRKWQEQFESTLTELRELYKESDRLSSELRKINDKISSLRYAVEPSLRRTYNTSLYIDRYSIDSITFEKMIEYKLRNFSNDKIRELTNDIERLIKMARTVIEKSKTDRMANILLSELINSSDLPNHIKVLMVESCDS